MVTASATTDYGTHDRRWEFECIVWRQSSPPPGSSSATGPPPAAAVAAAAAPSLRARSWTSPTHANASR